uniref:Uncharacterized protein n=1 Tax=Caenorhabditis japonica TaxID=281687 RepID=A0A8R1DW82_CAEJA
MAVRVPEFIKTNKFPGYSSTTYSPSSSTAYSTQYYNPSGAMQNSQTGYSTQPSYTNSASPQQNYVAYDTTNQNSPYYYQRVPSTAQYNSVLGVNAGYPQYTSASGQGTGTGTGMQNQLLSDPYNNQGQTQTSTAFMTYAAQQTTYSNDYNQYPYTNQPMYDSSSYQTTQSPQYSADAISCCSQVSSTCCYQTAQGNGAQANVPYSSSVYQYGRKR